MSCYLFCGPVLANTKRATHRKCSKKQSQIHMFSVMAVLMGGRASAELPNDLTYRYCSNRRVRATRT
jgi:hypothetical protein